MSETNGNQDFITYEVADQEVDFAVRFTAGHPLTANEAKVIQAAYMRQFTNNQNALAKARAEGKNKTPQLTAEELAAAFLTYEPNIGGERISNMEKVRNEATWRVWVQEVTDHNNSVENGGEPVIRAAGKQVVGLRFEALKDESGAVVATPAERKDAHIKRMQELPRYTDRIQAAVDAVLAERGKEKGKSTVKSVSTAGLLD